MDMLHDNFFVFVCLFFLYLSSTSKLVKRNNENERNTFSFLFGGITSLTVYYYLIEKDPKDFWELNFFYGAGLESRHKL